MQESRVRMPRLRLPNAVGLPVRLKLRSGDLWRRRAAHAPLSSAALEAGSCPDASGATLSWFDATTNGEAGGR